MSERPTTVWVTKYAVTSGIYEAFVTGENNSFLSVQHPARGDQVLVPSEWRPTREAALARANEMKAAKIASLKRQIAKLEALEF
ncbi:hypothetical protein [Methylorubrum sp. SL192]|uniref:hypothetical protein n=1 Tax=Methylorubrum sp. SL192 TaxID=2995167 RepID=UPI001AE8CE02|nr:hypothetical protein [Methylorubrum sp. SL192]MCY1644799.1 hypothetical protein [Methylorubrum sp. SL192]